MKQKLIEYLARVYVNHTYSRTCYYTNQKLRYLDPLPFIISAILCGTTLIFLIHPIALWIKLLLVFLLHKNLTESSKVFDKIMSILSAVKSQVDSLVEQAEKQAEREVDKQESGDNPPDDVSKDFDEQEKYV